MKTPTPTRAAAMLAAALAGPAAADDSQLDTVTVSASRIAQRSFDAAASVESIELDPFRAASPLVNLSEVLAAAPGIQIRERQNYAQDLQLSVRGFGSRSTFGVRGVRILVDGIPATMPDGQGQAATAMLRAARRIEVLRGPAAQLYGNAAGGVLLVDTARPRLGTDAGTAAASLGFGGDGQRETGFTLGAGGAAFGGLLDVSDFETDGFRAHGAARRRQLNGKLLWQPAAGTSVTGIVNLFDQPLAQDPLGLTREQFARDPRGSAPAAFAFDTRKSVAQRQAGVVLEHKTGAAGTLSARVYAGTRQVRQYLAFSGAAPGSSGGVIDLDNQYGGLGLSWTRATRLYGRPFNWTVGAEADALDQHRRGYVNESGSAGALRRDEMDEASNVDVFGQLEWMFADRWKLATGIRASRVRLAVDDRYVTAASPDDSGEVSYRHASPVLGLVWHATDTLNLYGNLGRGFETPTLAEAAYRPGASGPNFDLAPARSRQAEIGLKWRGSRDLLDLALFVARSRDEIVPLTTEGGRSIYQNVDQVERRGIEAAWRHDAGRYATRLAWTLLDARFRRGYATAAGEAVAAGNRLPGVPRHSLYAEFEYRPAPGLSVAAEMRTESKTWVDDRNSEAAPGYAVFNVRGGQELRAGAVNWFLFGRIDNLFDRSYAGSVIVNDGNGRYYEAAPGRRLFVGLRASL